MYTYSTFTAGAQCAALNTKHTPGKVHRCRHPAPARNLPPAVPGL